ncbi:MAG: hypothetical protein HC828_12505 [Blastochloris sp.]|nr:hypothetical protein [Blastochloris sp.]
MIVRHDDLLDDVPLHPDALMYEFCRAYERVYGCPVHMRYRGSGWFVIDNEYVHYRLVRAEVNRLRLLVRKQDFAREKRSILTRLIQKVRGL